MNTSRQGIKALLLLNYISIASASSAVITPALPQIESYYHLSHGLLEWVVTIFLIGYVVGQLVYGPLANKLGRVGALRLGLSINLAGIIICVLAYLSHDYWLLLVGRLVTALGASSGLVCSFILINESFDQARARQTISYAIVSFTLGIALSIFLGGLITQYLGWVYCFGLIFIHGLILFLLSYTIDETLPKQARKPQNLQILLKSYAQVFTNVRIWIFAVIVGFVSVFSYTFSAAGPMIAHELLSLSPSHYGSWNLLNSVGMLTGGLFAAQLTKRMQSMPIMILGLAGAFICVLALIGYYLFHSTIPLWFFAITALMFFTSGLIYASAAFFGSNAVEDKASGSAVMNFINMSTAVLAVAVMGYLPVSSLAAFIVVNAILLFVIIIMLLTARRLFGKP